MKKKQLLKFLLAGALIIASAICISSCKKNNEANEELNSLPMGETVYCEGREGGFLCPYCQVHEIVPGEVHCHIFEPGGALYLEDGSFNTIGDKYHPYPYDYCETYWNLPTGAHVCSYAVAGIKHGHAIQYYTEGFDGWTHNSWHVGGYFPGW